MSTNAYREKKNCKGLSVMVCNAFVTLADGIWAASSAEDMSLNTPVACQSVALWRDVGGALDGVHKSHFLCWAGGIYDQGIDSDASPPQFSRHWWPHSVRVHL